MQIPKHTSPFLFLGMRARTSSSARSRLRPAASRHTRPPKDAKRICQNGARGHRCFEASINYYHSGKAFITSESSIVLGRNILFMLEFIIHSSASGICKKQDQKKKSSELPVSLRVLFFPCNKRIRRCVCCLFYLAHDGAFFLFHHVFQLCIFSTNSLN